MPLKAQLRNKIIRRSRRPPRQDKNHTLKESSALCWKQRFGGDGKGRGDVLERWEGADGSTPRGPLPTGSSKAEVSLNHLIPRKQHELSFLTGVISHLSSHSIGDGQWARLEGLGAAVGVIPWEHTQGRLCPCCTPVV